MNWIWRFARNWRMKRLETDFWNYGRFTDQSFNWIPLPDNVMCFANNQKSRGYRKNLSSIVVNIFESPLNLRGFFWWSDHILWFAIPDNGTKTIGLQSVLLCQPKRKTPFHFNLGLNDHLSVLMIGSERSLCAFIVFNFGRERLANSQCTV